MSKIFGMDEGRDEDDCLSSSGKTNKNSPLLAAVSCAEDRLLIVDVLNAIRMCRHPHGQLCTSWSVHPTKTGYTLTAYLPKPTQDTYLGNHMVEVTHDDLNLIQSVNLMRVRIGIAHLNADTWALQVHITGHRSPISFTVHDTMRFTQRRAMLWNSSPPSLPANPLSTLQSSTSSTLDHGKTLFRNIFSRGGERFSISQDNTNPMSLVASGAPAFMSMQSSPLSAVGGSAVGGSAVGGSAVGSDAAGVMLAGNSGTSCQPQNHSQRNKRERESDE